MGSPPLVVGTRLGVGVGEELGLALGLSEDDGIGVDEAMGLAEGVGLSLSRKPVVALKV